MTTIRSALRWAVRQLDAVETPDLDAQLLLAFALDVERVYLLAHGDERLGDCARRRFDCLIQRRVAGEPIAYITGRKAFYDSDFLVTPVTLIPRPETELLLEEALRSTNGASGLLAADIATGCGNLAVTLARHRPECHVYACDVSEAALDVARQNARCHGASVDFSLGDLALPLIERGIKVDLLLANLPYIKTAELDGLAVREYEPRLALDGGEDGLRLIRRLLRQTRQVCWPGALVLLEIGAAQGEAVRELVSQHVGASADILRDYAGLDRIARFRV